VITDEMGVAAGFGSRSRWDLSDDGFTWAGGLLLAFCRSANISSYIGQTSFTSAPHHSASEGPIHREGRRC